VSALTEARPELDKMVAIYNERRRYILPRIKEIGLSVAVEPHGAFYVLANARHFTDDSLAFARELLEKANVAVAPGIDFGSGAEGYIRFSYATSLENIALVWTAWESIWRDIRFATPPSDLPGRLRLHPT